MKIAEMRKICKPLGITVECVWSYGFLVQAPSEQVMFDELEPIGFKVKGIGIGYDYNAKLFTLYAVKEK